MPYVGALRHPFAAPLCMAEPETLDFDRMIGSGFGLFPPGLFARTCPQPTLNLPSAPYADSIELSEAEPLPAMVAPSKQGDSPSCDLRAQVTMLWLLMRRVLSLGDVGRPGAPAYGTGANLAPGAIALCSPPTSQR